VATAEITASFALEDGDIIITLQTPDGPVKRSLGKYSYNTLEIDTLEMFSIFQFAFNQGKEAKAYELRLLLGVGGAI
jgi:hypothetical protein